MSGVYIIKKIYEMIVFYFFKKRHWTSLEIRDTKTNYHNHFNLFISHGKRDRKIGVYWNKIRSTEYRHMATSLTDNPDEERLIEVLKKLRPSPKKPSTHGSSMGPDVSLSSMRYIDLTILRFMFIGGIFLQFFKEKKIHSNCLRKMQVRLDPM